MTITDLWWSKNEKTWYSALNKYWENITYANYELEQRMEQLASHSIEVMSGDEFYDFLFNEYYVWKYTAKNRLATTRIQLQRYQIERRIHELADIKADLLAFDLNDKKKGLEIATKIMGLGTAGASGLLAVLFPNHFATVDQFVVKALRIIDGIPERAMLEKMNPDGLRIKDGVILINIMEEKATELNHQFNTSYWTPRKIDKILWATR